MPGMVEHAYNASVGEAETGGSFWPTSLVKPGRPRPGTISGQEVRGPVSEEQEPQLSFCCHMYKFTYVHSPQMACTRAHTQD